MTYGTIHHRQPASNYPYQKIYDTPPSSPIRPTHAPTKPSTLAYDTSDSLQNVSAALNNLHHNRDNGYSDDNSKAEKHVAVGTLLAKIAFSIIKWGLISGLIIFVYTMFYNRYFGRRPGFPPYTHPGANLQQPPYPPYHPAQFGHPAGPPMQHPMAPPHPHQQFPHPPPVDKNGKPMPLTGGRPAFPPGFYDAPSNSEPAQKVYQKPVGSQPTPADKVVSVARVFKDVNARMSSDYWDWETAQVTYK